MTGVGIWFTAYIRVLGSTRSRLQTDAFGGTSQEASTLVEFYWHIEILLEADAATNNIARWTR